MTIPARTILIPWLLLSLAGPMAAQEGEVPLAAEEATAELPPPQPLDETAAADASPPADDEAEVSAYQIRSRFTDLLRQHPRELARILALDPTLLSNESFLARYPDLARFVTEHPEVRRNPHFYLVEFGERRDAGVLSELFEGLVILAVFLLIAVALAWLIRTIIEQRRWNRLSAIQSEVHNKILDRFGTSQELLEYVRTPAGTKFLESAPIPLHAERPTQNLPLARVMLSIQVGIVVGAAAVGMIIVSGRFDPETNHGLFALGIIGLCLGAGFVSSAAASLFLSRRLGIWEPPSRASSADRLDDSGAVG